MVDEPVKRKRTRTRKIEVILVRSGSHITHCIPNTTIRVGPDAFSEVPMSSYVQAQIDAKVFVAK